MACSDLWCLLGKGGGREEEWGTAPTKGLLCAALCQRRGVWDPRSLSLKVYHKLWPSTVIGHSEIETVEETDLGFLIASSVPIPLVPAVAVRCSQAGSDAFCWLMCFLVLKSQTVWSSWDMGGRCGICLLHCITNSGPWVCDWPPVFGWEGGCFLLLWLADISLKCISRATEPTTSPPLTETQAKFYWQTMHFVVMVYGPFQFGTFLLPG